MKVTLASYHTVMHRHGGPKTQILQTMRYLKDRGVDVRLMDMWNGGDTWPDCDLFHLFASNLGVYDLARYLASHGVKYVVSPIFFTRRSPVTIRLVRTAGRLAKKAARGLWSDYGFAADICHWAHHCLPNSSEERNLVTRGLGVPPHRVTVVPNGVEERFLKADPEPFYRKYGVRDFILNVGHIGVERKNTLSLIRALSRIDHPAVIIGRITPSKETDTCLKEARKNDNLLIIPGLDHDSPLLASAYAACRVFVLPAYYETPGIAALEAALAGAAVVITPHGGTRDYFHDMATYVNPYSVDSIRRGIETALNREKDDRLKTRIQERYLWQTVAERTEEIYRTVLSSSGSDSRGE
ncbi:MAG: glycosyltransferase [Fidelibacterota bacterium]